MAAIIPDHLFVTFKKEQDGTILGFASPHGADAAAEKRRSTQTSWAYSAPDRKYVFNEEKTDILSCTLITYDWSSGRRTIVSETEVEVDETLRPKVLENKILPGYKISESVRRSGWNGGNVVWRILDPRGFELEISSANFARIVDCTTIANGVIQGSCVWGREGAHNLLLPEASDIYQEAKIKTDMTKGAVSLRDVKIGDHIMVLNNNLDNVEDLPLTYLGKVDFLTTELDSARFVVNDTVINTSSAFRTKGGRYVFIKTFKVSAVVGHSEVDLQKEMVAANEYLQVDRSSSILFNYSYRATHRLVVPAKSKVKFVLEKLNEAVPTSEDWPSTDAEYSWNKKPRLLILKKGDEWFVPMVITRDNKKAVGICNVDPFSVADTEIRGTPLTVQQEVNQQYWQRTAGREPIVNCVYNPEEYTPFQVTAVVGYQCFGKLDSIN